MNYNYDSEPLIDDLSESEDTSMTSRKKELILAALKKSKKGDKSPGEA